MSSVDTFLHLAAARAAYLVPVLVAACILGEPLARLMRFPQARAALGNIIARLNTKLNRTKRSTATRLYRGIVALAMLLIPAVLLAYELMRMKEDWISLLVTILLVAGFGELLRPYQLWHVRRAAKQNTLTLQSTDPHFLFADTHAQLRYYTIDAAARVVLLIGGTLYYLLADLPGLAVYFTIAAAARFYAPSHTGNLAFGWAATSLAALLDILPRSIAGLLATLAAIFTPHSSPIRPLRHGMTAMRRFYGWLAYLLNLSLGGPVPSAAGETVLPWIGSGTPKPDATHFTRAVQLVGITLLLWILVLGSTIYLFPIVK